MVTLCKDTDIDMRQFNPVGLNETTVFLMQEQVQSRKVDRWLGWPGTPDKMLACASQNGIASRSEGHSQLHM